MGSRIKDLLMLIFGGNNCKRNKKLLVVSIVAVRRIGEQKAWELFIILEVFSSFSPLLMLDIIDFGEIFKPSSIVNFVSINVNEN